MLPRRGPRAIFFPVPGALTFVIGALVLLLALPALVSAQQSTGTLAGRVMDAGRAGPVGFAQVGLPGLGRSTLADGEGRFRFESLPVGTHRLTVAFLGFEATVREVTVEAGAIQRLEVWVTPEPIPMEELEVTTLALSWFPGFRDRRTEGRGHFFTARDIAEADPDHLSDLLRGAEGVRIGYNRYAHGASRRYPQFYRRGPAYHGIGRTRGRLLRRSPHCRPAMFVDGNQIGPGHAYWHFNEIPPDEVLAMEVFYRGQDVPESIPFADMRFAGTDGSVPSPPLAPPPPSSGDEGEVRRVLADAGLADGFERPVPDEFEEAAVQRTVYAGLYERRPEVKYCGAIFVWTDFYP